MRNVVCCFIGSSVLTFSFPAISQSCLKNLVSHHSPFLFNNPLSAIAFTISCITGTGSTRANRINPLRDFRNCCPAHRSVLFFPSVPYRILPMYHVLLAPVPIQTSYLRCPEHPSRCFAKSAAECLISSLIFFALCKHCVLRPFSLSLPHRTGSAEKHHSQTAFSQNGIYLRSSDFQSQKKFLHR